MWMEDVDVSILSYSSWHIHVEIKMKNLAPWRFTGFYGHPVTYKRKEPCHLLCLLKDMSNLPWLIVGDFNELLSHDEKYGDALRPSWQMAYFKETVNACRLQEVPFSGPMMTWCWGSGTNMILERLDRSFVTTDWLNLFPTTIKEHLMSSMSDHLYLFLKIKTESQVRSLGGRFDKSFKFENLWCSHDSCRNIIDEVWHKILPNSVVGMDPCLRECAKDLSK
ncbi:hypothetical protein REPUB_Repub15cG0057700 [Reevesia pubescens]